MQIELEYPYKDLYKHGYLVKNKEPRRNVILYNSKEDRSTISYAKYLTEVYLKSFLDKRYVVDHIDDNQLNDTLENFQLLTIEENNIKGIQNKNSTELLVEFSCGICSNMFIKAKNQTHLIIKSKKSDYCSRSCSSKASHSKIKSIIIKEFRKEHEDIKGLKVMDIINEN